MENDDEAKEEEDGSLMVRPRRDNGEKQRSVKYAVQKLTKELLAKNRKTIGA